MLKGINSDRLHWVANPLRNGDVKFEVEKDRSLFRSFFSFINNNIITKKGLNINQHVISKLETNSYNISTSFSYTYPLLVPFLGIKLPWTSVESLRFSSELPSPSPDFSNGSTTARGLSGDLDLTGLSEVSFDGFSFLLLSFLDPLRERDAFPCTPSLVFSWVASVDGDVCELGAFALFCGVDALSLCSEPDPASLCKCTKYDKRNRLLINSLRGLDPRSITISSVGKALVHSKCLWLDGRTDQNVKTFRNIIWGRRHRLIPENRNDRLFSR